MNYKILNSILNIDPNVFSNEDTSDIKDPSINNPFIIDILKLKTAKIFLEEKKYNKTNSLLKNLHNKYDFIKKERNKLNLEYLYFKNKYNTFIEQFYSDPINDLNLKLLLIKSLVKTKRRSRAFFIFKNLLKKEKLSQFKELLSPKVLSQFLSKLDNQFWIEKFNFLIRNNNFKEFLIEKKYLNSPQLINLFSSEFYYKRKRYRRAQILLNNVRSDDLSHLKKRLLIKIDLRLNNFNNVIDRIDELKEKRELYSKLLLNSASILLIKGKINLSLHLFSKYINLAKYNSSNDYDQVTDFPNYWKSLWVTAWLFMKKKNTEDALTYFRIGSNSPVTLYRLANLYWLYKLDDNNPDDIENYPFSYYYTKIKNRNNNNGLKNFINLINNKQSDQFLKIINDIKSLLRHNLVEECFDFINWAKNESNLTDSDRNMLSIIKSIIYLKRQNYYMAFTSFKNGIKNHLSLRLPLFLSEIYFPLDYTDLVEKYCTINNVDSMLIFSLIRSESFFNKNAVSSARARGLMQLMFLTARQIARKHKLNINRRDLFKPDINIRLGIEHFKFLLQRYKGKLHLAVAAYNAGFRRVDRWIKEFKNNNEDEFIEMIPFSETRNYTKNFFRDFYYYKFYYGRVK